jgi:hypothetical protein
MTIIGSWKWAWKLMILFIICTLIIETELDAYVGKMLSLFV